MFTNTRPLWHPPGARGVFGGAVIAQCLSAAQKTVPSDFSVHSMHCYFVLAGNAEIPITYHVERVRDGKSFITRTVQARQRARPIFTVTLSFQRVPKGDEKMVRHAVTRPDIAQPSEDDIVSSSGPFETLHRPMQRGDLVCCSMCLNMLIPFQMRNQALNTSGRGCLSVSRERLLEGTRLISQH